MRKSQREAQKLGRGTNKLTEASASLALHAQGEGNETQVKTMKVKQAITLEGKRAQGD